MLDPLISMHNYHTYYIPLVLLSDVVFLGKIDEVHDWLSRQEEMFVQNLYLYMYIEEYIAELHTQDAKGSTFIKGMETFNIDFYGNGKNGVSEHQRCRLPIIGCVCVCVCVGGGGGGGGGGN